jgi:NAD(P)-dependent dehydrogenase (short-subunit alcohol dehydrogenase family)
MRGSLLWASLGYDCETERLQGRVCVVAGAVGVPGEGVARRFADEGGIVVGIDRKEHAVGTLALQIDLADEVQVRAAYERVYRQLVRSAQQGWRPARRRRYGCGAQSRSANVDWASDQRGAASMRHLAPSGTIQFSALRNMPVVLA